MDIDTESEPEPEPESTATATASASASASASSKATQRKGKAAVVAAAASSGSTQAEALSLSQKQLERAHASAFRVIRCDELSTTKPIDPYSGCGKGSVGSGNEQPLPFALDPLQYTNAYSNAARSPLLPHTGKTYYYYLLLFFTHTKTITYYVLYYICPTLCCTHPPLSLLLVATLRLMGDPPGPSPRQRPRQQFPLAQQRLLRRGRSERRSRRPRGTRCRSIRR
jgi:hypothetical protein